MVENCDVMTPEENLAKGSKLSKSRFVWQDEFVEAWMLHILENFFLCALPGGGKTHAAGRVAETWIERGGIIVVVSPTRGVRRNWRDYFENRKRYLDENFYGALKEGYCGITITYAALNSQVMACRKLCQDHRVLLICDEIHHASEDERSSWGQDLREAFQRAKKRLLLSGTPVRSDRENTSFLEIEEFTDLNGQVAHRYEAHYTFDWPRALEDRTIRSVTFHRLAMETVDVMFAVKGKKVFSSSEDEYLSYALDHNPYIHSFFQAGLKKLEELRRSDLTAAGIVLCKNIGHAKKCYGILESMGEQPVLITSAEEEDSTELIKQFKNDHSKQWLVSVRQVWEGVDIPRLRVELYLTNYTTELAFRQAVGRVVRRREDETDADAQGHVFIPETPKLASLAAKIEKLQELAMKRLGEGEPPAPGERGYVVDGAEPEFIGYIIHGQHYIGDRASVIRELMNEFKATEETASIMLNTPKFASGIKIGETPQDHERTTVETPPWVHEVGLKSDIREATNKLIRIRLATQGLSAIYDRNNREIWKRFAQEVHAEFRVGRKPQRELGVNELKAKLERLRNATIREERIK